MNRKLRLLFAMVVLLATTGCHRRRHPPSPTEGVSFATAAPVAQAAGSLVDATNLVLRSWDDAHNRHDVGALRQLYAPTVDFYGKQLTVDAVVAAKARVFQKTPDFRQDLSALKFDDTANHVRASFAKAWFQNGKGRTIGASVEVARFSDGRLLIVKETDDSIR
jgi:hypothetical protein